MKKIQIDKLKNKFNRFGVLFLVFSFLKIIVFISPIFMSQVESSDKYGNFEYSLNIAFVLMGIFTMGFSGGYAYFIANKKRLNYSSVFHLHYVILSFLLLSVTLIFPELLQSYFLTAVIMGVFLSNQLIISTILKLKNLNISSIFIDSLLYIILISYLIVNYFNDFSFSFFIWNIILLIFLFSNSYFYHFKEIKFDSLKISHFKDIYTYGLLMVLATPLVSLVNASSRIFINKLIGVETVALFSFYFRIACVILIVYKVINIMLFREIFVESLDLVDKYYRNVNRIIFSLVILVIIFSFYFLGFFFPEFDFSQKNELFITYFLCCFHVYFWINNSLLEPIFQRLYFISNYIKIYFLCLILLMISLYALAKFELILLNNILLVNIAIMILAHNFQIFFLKNRGINLNRFNNSNIIFTVFFIIFSTFLLK